MQTQETTLESIETDNQLAMTMKIREAHDLGDLEVSAHNLEKKPTWLVLEEGTAKATLRTAVIWTIRRTWATPTILELNLPAIRTIQATSRATQVRQCQLPILPKVTQPRLKTRMERMEAPLTIRTWAILWAWAHKPKTKTTTHQAKVRESTTAAPRRHQPQAELWEWPALAPRTPASRAQLEA